MNAPNTLITQVRVLDPVTNTDQIANVWINEGKIQAIAPHPVDVPADTVVMEGLGLILAPGLVDLYSHSGEPGYEERETLDSLAQAAIAGGFTRLNILPDTTPPLDHPAQISFLQQKSPQTPHFSYWGAITQNLQGEQMTELGELSQTDIVGFTDNVPLQNGSLLRRTLEYSQTLGKPLAFVAGDPNLQDEGVVWDGAFAIQAGLPSIPQFAETASLAALIEVLEVIPTPVHIMRVATARGVELIAQAKEKGLPITASTTWLHLLCDSTALHDYNPHLRLNPPLPNPEDRLALATGVKNGIIDAIAIDHSPYTYEEKTVAFAEAPPGSIGLEFALPLLWQQFVAQGEWSALQLWHALSIAPQRILGRPPLHCTVGEKTELILFDPQHKWMVEAQNLKSKSLNTSWLGQEITGKVLQVFC